MSTTPSFTACYEWTLPEFTCHHVNHLTSGYIRCESRKHSLYIPRDITQTCMKYYYNLNIVNTIKTAPNGLGFKSNLFGIGPFKFYMDVFPNGYDSESEGNIDWFLNLCSISPTINKIAFKYEICIKENGHKYTNTARLNHDELSVGWDEVLLTQICDLNTLTFVLYIIIYDLLNENDESIMNEYKHLFKSKPIHEINCKMQTYLIKNATFYTANSLNESVHFTPLQTQFIDSLPLNYSLLPSDCGEWIINDDILLHKIRNCANGIKFDSEIFIANGFKWSIKLYPNGTGVADVGKVDLGIYLVTLSPNISKIWIQYKILLHETGTKREDTVGFARRAMGYLFITTLTTKQLCQLSQLSFTAEILIFDVYNQKGNVITNYYTMHNQTLNDMKRQAYQWNINPHMLQQIKQCAPASMFLSEFFQLHGFKWFLELYPKGQSHTNDSNNNNNNEQNNDVNLYLTLLSIAPNLSSVSINFELSLLQISGARYGAFEQMGSQCMSYGWPCNIVKSDELMNLNHGITFNVNIKLIDIYNEKGIAIHDNMDEMDQKENIINGLTLPMSRYKWMICDPIFVEKIRNASNAHYFASPIFELESLKWVMQICPNGSSPIRKGYFNWYLHLASLPTNINKMYIFYRIYLQETQSLYEYRTVFQCRQPGKGWGNDKLTHDDIINLNTFTFKLDIIIIDIFDNHGNNINHNYKKYHISPINNMNNQNKYISDYYEWNINDIELINKIKSCTNGYHFNSAQFNLCGFKWFLQLYPNGKDKTDENEFKLYINLKLLPEEPYHVSGISCHFKLYVNETNTIYSDFAHFRKDFLFDGWQSSRIKTNEIINFDKLTMKVMIKIIDIYDANGMSITDKYRNNVNMFLS